MVSNQTSTSNASPTSLFRAIRKIMLLWLIVVVPVTALLWFISDTGYKERNIVAAIVGISIVIVTAVMVSRTATMVGKWISRLRAHHPGVITGKRVYLGLVLLCGLVGIKQWFWWSGSGSLALWCAVNILPAGIFLGAYALAGRKGPQILVTILAVLSVIPWLLFNVLVTSTSEVKVVRNCERILKDYWSFDPELVSHFPRPIPSDARNIRFSFVPAFLQGGAHIQLRYATSPAIVTALRKRFLQKTTKTFQGGDWAEHVNQQDGMATTSFYTGDTTNYTFPGDYEILIFDRLPTEEWRRHASWEHVNSHGVAISTNRSEIIYWAEAP